MLDLDRIFTFLIIVLIVGLSIFFYNRKTYVNTCERSNGIPISGPFLKLYCLKQGIKWLDYLSY